eukprot:TRINITY_DN12948_c0_g3_i2.p1 TRINITY_DN12948_c0_g3~~TRINITY_DN12948_c0_g3_i2.p1  ORF type:complete len:1228 (+),score=254.99 TRINITY_DN12948_c0_g3_i2:33-3716(+)
MPSPVMSMENLHSLQTLERDLEESFSLLKRRLQAVSTELRQFSQPAPKALDDGLFMMTASPSLFSRGSTPSSPKVETAPLELPSLQHGRGNALEVPEQLKHAASMGNYMQNIGIAAARARASGQPKDLASTSAASDERAAMRLHPRWMELATKCDQSTAQSSRVAVRAKTVGRKRSKEKLPAQRTKSFEMVSNSSFLRRMKIVHPHSRFRLGWDLVGLSLVMLDAFLLPLSLAWDLSILPVDAGGAMLLCAFLFALFYWCADVFMSFNTGIYQAGQLVTDRFKIFCNYMRTFFLFDMVLVGVDIATFYGQFGGSSEQQDSSSTEVLRSIRSLRVLRAMRLLRLVKMSRLSTVIEEASVAAGRQWLVLVVAILKTVFVAMISAHGLACCWYLIGRLRSESGEQSWLTLAKAEHVGLFAQYLHAFQWILTPPSPLPVDPDSIIERMYCIIIVASVVFVIGGCLSKITGTLAEIRTINSEGSRKRREVRQYLQAQHVSMELTQRIMRFVDYKLERQSSVSLDHSLISPSLHIELHVSQRGGILSKLPIFQLTEDLFPEVFAALCGVLEKQVFGKQEFVFVADSWAQGINITSIGTFRITDETARDEIVSPRNNEGSEAQVFTGIHWFSEAALFAESMVHEVSLRAETFGEAYSLTGEALAHCLLNSPSCTAMLCEYAKALLANVVKHGERTLLEECSTEACQKNSFYLQLHPDPKTMLENIGKKLQYESEEGSEYPLALVAVEASRDLEAEQEEPEPSPAFNASDLAQQVLHGQIPQQDLLPKMREALPELAVGVGLQDLLSLPGEREKSESCVLSIIALVTGSYEAFTAPQAEQVRLKPQQWSQLRQLVQWTEVDATMLHAVIVLLAIRSLGKSKRVTQQLPKAAQRPEQALIYLMRNRRNCVPSVESLTEDAFDLICNALEIHQEFNLAQMLQGENTPASVMQLQSMIRERGVEVFRFYILFLLGFMSGLAGGVGSRFMNAKNSEATITGIQCMLHVLDSSPEAVYWSFIFQRAQQLSLPVNTPEDIALVRLACLSRVQDKSGFLQLCMSWQLLGMRERQVLIDHFLGDGINEQTLVFEFLPLCMANAKENKFVSVHVLLEVLVDLIEDLRRLDPSKFQMASPRGGQVKTLNVDLTDMAEFIAAVQNRFVFQNCVSRCKLRFADRRFYLSMTGDNWGRTQESDTDTTMLAYSVKELLQRQKFLHELVAQTLPSSEPFDEHDAATELIF